MTLAKTTKGKKRLGNALDWSTRHGCFHLNNSLSVFANEPLYILIGDPSMRERLRFLQWSINPMNRDYMRPLIAIIADPSTITFFTARRIRVQKVAAKQSSNNLRLRFWSLP